MHTLVTAPSGLCADQLPLNLLLSCVACSSTTVPAHVLLQVQMNVLDCTGLCMLLLSRQHHVRTDEQMFVYDKSEALLCTAH